MCSAPAEDVYILVLYVTTIVLKLDGVSVLFLLLLLLLLRGFNIFNGMIKVLWFLCDSQFTSIQNRHR